MAKAIVLFHLRHLLVPNNESSTMLRLLQHFYFKIIVAFYNFGFALITCVFRHNIEFVMCYLLAPNMFGL